MGEVRSEDSRSGKRPLQDLGVAHASRETPQRQRRASEDNGMTIAVGSPRAPLADVMLADARAERPGNEGWQFPCV